MPRKHSIKRTMKKNHGFCCDSTFYGLQSWYAAMFEKLGWMLLAKHRGIVEKISVYQNGVQRLKESIEHKMKDTKDHDRKADLEIMHENVCILLEHITKDFK